jgi:hypothetical protein
MLDDLVDASGAQRWGTFDRAVRANLIDAKIGLPRPLRKLRLKEWQAIQIASPALFANVALFDAKLMQLRQVKVFERARGEKIIHEKKLRPGAFRLADQILASRNAHAGLAFDNRVGDGRIEVEIDVGDVRGHLVVHTELGASQVVSLPFDERRGMYSHKGMFPVEGVIEIGGRRHELRDALALLDDHKGYYPYVMKWDWLTSASVVGGHAKGFNLTRNQCRDPETFHENCAWIGARRGALPPVTFARERARKADERWTVRDRDGKVDLEFFPTIPGDVRVQAIVVESRYRGPFGRVVGRLAPEGLDPIEVDGWLAMGEEFWLRC